jgi:DNA polymerase III epsilon subunit-like protein
MGIEYFILDTETLGLKVNFHSINQISVIHEGSGEQITINIKVKHPERASQEALAIQQITYADLRKGIPSEEAVKKVSEFISSWGATPNHRCTVCHNAPFDRKFCHQEWQDSSQVFPSNLWLCTKKFAQAYVKKHSTGEKIARAQKNANPLKPKFGLNDFLNGIGITPKIGAHSAEVDTQNTLDLFHWLQKSNTEYISLIENKPHEFGRVGASEEDSE